MSKKDEALKLALEALEQAHFAFRLIAKKNEISADAISSLLKANGLRTNDAPLGAMEDIAEQAGGNRNICANAITAIREALAEQPAQQDSETIAQTFTGLPKRKLRDLLAAGWQVNGVCFQRTEENGVVRRGAATTGGMVLWWNAEQPTQQQEPVAIGALAKRRVFDYIRGAYDLGYNDARNAKAVPGDGAPGYKGRDAEADHGGALLHALQSITPPQPAQRKPLTDGRIRDGAAWQWGWYLDAFKNGVRFAEAAHGIKGDA